MTKHFILGVTLLNFLIICGCSVKDATSPSPPSPAIGEEDPGPVPIGQDSTTAIYRQFFFMGTHNSYSGNLAGMQREGIATQLERGLRFYELDLYTFHTQNKLNTTWAEEDATFSVFDFMGNTHLLSYTKKGGQIQIVKLTSHDPEIVYQNTIDPLEEIDRRFSVLSFGTNLYILDYQPTNGNLTIYNFAVNSLTFVHSENIGIAEAHISPFKYKGDAYLAVHAPENANYRIHAINLGGSGTLLGDPLYEDTSISLHETLYPFEQDNRLYIFRHNSNTVTNYVVASVDTNGDKWSIQNSIRGTSNLLKGRVQASLTNDKLYINAYAANGEVVGTQLIMDRDKPNLVYEYNNEVAMLSGAQATIYPAIKGYYLLLQKKATIQLSYISIGELTVGHDAPGDEVDFSVDNPDSIFLEDWIKYIADWSSAHPYHEPLFIMTELKMFEQWLADAKWQNIIRLMQGYFGEKLRYHSSNGFHNEPIVDGSKIVDGKKLYYFDENGSKEGGLLGKVILYIQPNNRITQSNYTNNFQPFETKDGKLQENFMQLKRYRENNKFASTDWRKPQNYGNDIGVYLDSKDHSYISRIFHMQSSAGDGQYDNIRCTDVMFAVSDRPFQGLYKTYVDQQKIKNNLERVPGCD